MPALNFQAQFADSVEKGWKRQTVRANRKRPIRVGDRLRLFTGMRTKACRFLREERCLLPIPVTIEAEESVGLRLDGYWQGAASRESFARADGFPNYADMVAWFKQTHGLPFEGVVIYW